MDPCVDGYMDPMELSQDLYPCPLTPFETSPDELQQSQKWTMMPGEPSESSEQMAIVTNPAADATTNNESLPRQKKTLYARPSPTTAAVVEVPQETPKESAQESSTSLDTQQGTLNDAWSMDEPPLVPDETPTATASQLDDDSFQEHSMQEDNSSQQQQQYQNDSSAASEQPLAASKYSMGPRDPTIDSLKNARVYVGNLTYETGWEDLKQLMEEAGTVIHVEIMTFPGGTKSKGCGIVEFSSPDEAQNAIKTLNERDLQGRPVFLREDRESKPGFSSSSSGVSRDAGRQLFVGNLAYEVAWQDLKDFFRDAGAIIRADVQSTASGRSKGCGTVLFETIDDAQKAICKILF